MAFLEWEAHCWEEQEMEHIWTEVPVAADTTASATIPIILEGALDEGLHAYAQHQATIWHKLFTCFSAQWNDVPTFIQSWNDWLGDPVVQGRPHYLIPVPPIVLL